VSAPSTSSTVPTFAVGDANSLESRFATRLAAVLKNNSSRLRLKIVPNADSAKALAQFDHQECDQKHRRDGETEQRCR
jgi:hypothetical protein